MGEPIQNRFGTDIAVSFPQFPTIDFSLRQFKLIQEAGKHDIAELYFSSFSKVFYKALTTGVLVQVSWKNQNSSGQFYGHVYGSNMKQQSTITRNVLIKAMGASFPLKESKSKIWVNKTASEVVTAIAKLASIKAVVTPTKLRYEQISMSGHTYWQKIQELAKRSGYVAQMIDAELHFHPMDVMLAKCSTSIPILAQQDNEIPFGLVHESPTLDYFEAHVDDLGEHGNHSRRDKVVSGVDPVTGKKYSHTVSPNKVGKKLRKQTKDSFFSEHIPGQMSYNSEGAKELAEAQAQLARWSISAEGEGQGDARIAPYRTVQISGTFEHTDGFWIIQRAEHSMLFDGRYTVSFTCLSDGLYENQTALFRTDTATLMPTRNIELELSSSSKTSLLGQAALKTNTSYNGLKTTPKSARVAFTRPIIKSTKKYNSVCGLTPSRWVSL
jgi:phage protein D